MLRRVPRPMSHPWKPILLAWTPMAAGNQIIEDAIAPAVGKAKHFGDRRIQGMPTTNTLRDTAHRTAVGRDG